MRCSNRTGLGRYLALGTAIAAFGCGGSRWAEVPSADGALKTVADVRAERRLYDGAPPVISHIDFGTDCSGCHKNPGVSMRGVGFAPPSPHLESSVEAFTARCRQCHVYSTSGDFFVDNSFVGLPQNMRLGGQLNPISPPRFPHRILMRENCLACHAGPAVRQEIATTHPERIRCRQCHVVESSRSEFESALGEGLGSQN